jgi:hypothetical protein
MLIWYLSCLWAQAGDGHLHADHATDSRYWNIPLQPACQYLVTISVRRVCFVIPHTYLVLLFNIPHSYHKHFLNPTTCNILHSVISLLTHVMLTMYMCPPSAVKSFLTESLISLQETFTCYITNV